MGYPDSEFTVNVEGVIRRHDMGDEINRFAVEYKSGSSHSTTKMGPDGGVGGNLWEVARDEILVRDYDWTIEWVFEVAPSEPLRLALQRAGISIKVLN
jgi:hypothetical protein